MQTRSDSNARGIDVSAFQGSINWKQVAADGISFAWIKATEGTTITDSAFGTSYRDAKNAGILRGAYHFARPGAGSAHDQAQQFVSVVQASGGFDQLPPVLDVEDDGGLSPDALATWIEDWMSIVKATAGSQPILYTYTSFADSHLNAALSNTPLWIASYQVNQPKDTSGWTHWTFWQYSDTGAVRGITGHVDLDVYAGTASDLQKAYGTTSAPNPPATYTQFTVFVVAQPYAAIAVGDVSYVLWTALNTLGTPHHYRGSGVMNINGKDVQGVVFEGNTYLPWDSLAPNINAERVWHFYT